MNSLIPLAPAVTDTDSLFVRWQQSHAASVDDFYQFLITPSPQRRLFFLPLQSQIEPQGQLPVHLISAT